MVQRPRSPPSQLLPNTRQGCQAWSVPGGAWRPYHVFERHRARHSDEPRTLPSRAMALQGSRSHLHGAKCVSKHGTAATPLSERVSSGRPLSGTGSSRGGGEQRGRRGILTFGRQPERSQHRTDLEHYHAHQPGQADLECQHGSRKFPGMAFLPDRGDGGCTGYIQQAK